MATVFDTPRLVLRHITEGDADFFLRLVSDPDWVRFIGDRGLRTVDEARAYLREKMIPPYAAWGFGLYCVESKATREPIGICGLLRRDTFEDVDLGFAFLPEARRQGFAHEAAAATMEHARSELGFHRVVAIVRPDNHASIALLEKLGFRFERTIHLPPATDRELLLYAVG